MLRTLRRVAAAPQTVGMGMGAEAAEAAVLAYS
jgi:hypothetical protein